MNSFNGAKFGLLIAYILREFDGLEITKPSNEKCPRSYNEGGVDVQKGRGRNNQIYYGSPMKPTSVFSFISPESRRAKIRYDMKKQTNRPP
jgi:hypothetical protein